jgi:anion-transporting  ArsA/GET3 family ATPase
MSKRSHASLNECFPNQLPSSIALEALKIVSRVTNTDSTIDLNACKKNEALVYWIQNMKLWQKIDFNGMKAVAKIQKIYYKLAVDFDMVYNDQESVIAEKRKQMNNLSKEEIDLALVEDEKYLKELGARKLKTSFVIDISEIIKVPFDIYLNDRIIVIARLLSTRGFQCKVWDDNKHMTLTRTPGLNWEDQTIYDDALEFEDQDYLLIHATNNEFVSHVESTKNVYGYEYLDIKNH